MIYLCFFGPKKADHKLPSFAKNASFCRMGGVGRSGVFLPSLANLFLMISFFWPKDGLKT